MRALVRFALFLVVAATGCSGIPVEPYAYAPPHFFAATDGNVTVIYAKVEGTAGVRLLPATEASVHLLGPVQLEEGRVLVRRNRPEKTSLSLRPGDPLPAWCRHLFTSTEVGALGLAFSEDSNGSP